MHQIIDTMTSKLSPRQVLLIFKIETVEKQAFLLAYSCSQLDVFYRSSEKCDAAKNFQIESVMIPAFL